MAVRPEFANARKALVVGISSFGGDLEALPGHHARGLSAALESLGCDTEVAEDCSGGELKRLLDSAIDSDVEVVHLLSHGDWRTSDRLLVAGSDASGWDDRRAWVDIRSWLSDLTESDGKPVLLTVDTCYAGDAAHLPWLDDGARKVYVLAAAEPGTLAFEARFTRAVTNVFNRLADGDTLGGHPSLEFLPLGLVKAAVAQELNRLCQESGGVPQRLASSRHELDHHVHGLFRNPAYPGGTWDKRLLALASEEPALADSIDPVMGGLHFLTRASGESPDRPPTVCHFVGRRAELRELSRWIDDPGPGDGLRVVVGSPGVGKSALVGVLVCTAHPALQPFSYHIESRIDADLKPERRRPGEVAAVNARNRDIAELVSSLERQLHAPTADGEVASLLDHIRSVASPPLIILDGLDEAVDPREIQLRLLVPLVSEVGLCRLVVGVRDEPRFQTLFDLAVNAGLIDLDCGEDGQLSRDIKSYVMSLLRDYSWPTQASVAFAETLAAALSPAKGVGRRDIGPFLLAQLHTHLVAATTPRPAKPEDVLAQAASAPRSVRDAFEQYVSSPAIDPSIKPMLIALAHARGAGMPMRLVEAIAKRLDPQLADATQQGLNSVLVEQARFYLRTDVDDDGAAVYALFHQSLQDYLRTVKYSASINLSAAEIAFDALLDEVGYGDHARPDWESRAYPYIRRHLGQHAIAAGRFDELAGDHDFLAHADPERLLRDLRYAQSREAQMAATVYRQSHHYHRRVPPLRRAQRLALDAARLGAIDLRDRFESTLGRPGVTRWSTGSEAEPQLLDILEVPSGGCTAITSGTAGERPLVISNGAGVLHVWDVTTGEPFKSFSSPGRSDVVTCAEISGKQLLLADGDVTRVWELPTGTVRYQLTRLEDQMLDAALTVVGGRAIAVVVEASGRARIWDLARAAPVNELGSAADHFLSVVCTTIKGRSVAVTGDGRGMVRLWDLATGSAITTLSKRTGRVLVLCCRRFGAQHILAAGDSEGAVRAWDLGSVEKLSVVRHPGKSVTALTLTRVDGRVRVVVGCFEKSVRLWDVTTGSLVEELSGHGSSVTSVADGDLLGRPVVVTAAHDRTMRVWDLLRPKPSDRSAPYFGSLLALAAVKTSAGGLVVTGGTSGVIRTLDAATGDHRDVFEGHVGGEVLCMTVATLDDRPVIVSGDDRGRICVWDPASCAQIRTQQTSFSAVRQIASTVFEGHDVVVIGDGAAHLDVLDVATGRSVRRLVDAHWDDDYDYAVEHGEQLPSEGPCVSIACHVTKERHLVAACSQPSSLWDMTTGELLRYSRRRTQYRAVNFSRIDGVAVTVFAGADNRIDISGVEWDELRSFATPVGQSLAGAISTTLDGRAILLTRHDSPRVCFWDLATGRQLDSHDFSGDVNAIVADVDVVFVCYGAEVAALHYPGVGR